MTEADSTKREHFIVPSDRALTRRLAIFALSVLVATFAVSRVIDTYSQKFYDLTGDAMWIWAQHRMSRNQPVVFYAIRDFDLPSQRLFTHVKIAADPEYTLYVNGRKVGGRRVGDERRLDVYDVSDLARDRANRIVVAVRSVNGVGGLLAAVDIAPDHENYVVTDGEWKIVRRWDDSLPLRDVPGLQASAPMIVGHPPIGRWNYLTRTGTPVAETDGEVTVPESAVSFKGQLPAIRVEGGIAVQGADTVRATAFDFGRSGVTGRVRLRLEEQTSVPPVVYVRLANSIEETRLVDWQFKSFAFGAGETTITDPEEDGFRYVVVYGGRATAEVVSRQGARHPRRGR